MGVHVRVLELHAVWVWYELAVMTGFRVWIWVIVKEMRVVLGLLGNKWAFHCDEMPHLWNELAFFIVPEMSLRGSPPRATYRR